MTILYSVLHFFVDGVCALAMFGYFAASKEWYLYLLLYNFCAFAMQMPLGVVLDSLNSGQRTKTILPSLGFAVTGVVLTLIGALTHPIVLGIGNALFHLGGGVGTIQEDQAKKRKGRGLGVFVAPGALGLYIGTRLAKAGQVNLWLMICAVVMSVLCVVVWRVGKSVWWLMSGATLGSGAAWKVVEVGAENVNRGKKSEDEIENVKLIKEGKGRVRQRERTVGKRMDNGSGVVWLVAGCLLVVILRSYIGMAVAFPWKNTLLAGTLAVLAVVFGKAAGGFLAASFGWRKTAVVSLLLAAISYCFSQNMLLGLFALFLFNMTMPITLYLLEQRLKGMPGFSFGILTFGLFLGFLPEYFGMDKLADGTIIGCVGSLVSLGILLLCTRVKGSL